MRGGDLSCGVTGAGRQARWRAALQRLDGRSGNGRPRGQRFQAAPIAARTRGAVGLDDNVAHLRAQPLPSLEQTPVQDNAAANTRADGQIDQVVYAAPGPEAVLAQRGQVGVVGQEGGPGERIGQTRAQRHIPPTGQVGGEEDHPCSGIQRPGRSDADGGRAALAGPHAPYRLLDALDDRLGPLHRPGGQHHPRLDVAVGPATGSSDLCATQVYDDE